MLHVVENYQQEDNHRKQMDSRPKVDRSINSEL